MVVCVRASPNAIQLTPDQVAFLREALAELPAMAPEHVDRCDRRTVTNVQAVVDVPAAGA